MRICSGPGCLRTVPDNVRFCDECNPTHTDDGIRSHTLADRERYQSLYESNRFQDYCRPRTLQRYPMCARCGVAPSVICDHIVPAGEAIRQVQESGRFPLSKYAGFFLLRTCKGCVGLATESKRTKTRRMWGRGRLCWKRKIPCRKRSGDFEKEKI